MLPVAALGFGWRSRTRAATVTREIKRAVYDAAARPAQAGLLREAASTIRTLTAVPLRICSPT